MTQPRCPYCGRWFEAGPEMGPRRVTCLDSACRSAHKKVLDRRWHTANPERTLGRQEKVRDWSAARGYWREWRHAHAAYVERNREQTRERMRKRREERRQARTILGNPVGYLRGLRADVCKTRTGGPLRSTRERATVDDVCKTRTGGWVVVGMVDYLIARELFAKHEDLDTAGVADG